MTDIKYSKIALTNYRADFRKMSREKLAECSGLSVSSIVRMETKGSETNSEESLDDDIAKMSNVRLAILANCLKIPQHKLWAEIPVSYDFVGTEINSATELAEIIFDDFTPPSKFVVRGIPNGEEKQGALKDIAKVVDHSRPESSLETLEGQIKIEEGFQVLVAENNSTFYKISISHFYANIFDRECRDNPEGTAAQFSWGQTIIILFSLDKSRDEPPCVTTNPIKGTANLENTSAAIFQDKAKQEEFLVWSRSDDIIPF